MLGACADVQPDDSADVIHQALDGEEAASDSAAVALDDLETLAGSQVFPDEVFTNLDYGLYWYGYDEGSTTGRYVKADQAGNPFYDPSRPTIIHIHGWQNGSIAKFSRDDFDHRRRATAPIDVDKDVAKPWIDQGYNVGMLYWTNFADEGAVGDAEAKIWSNKGPKLLKYRVRSSAEPNSTATEQRDFTGHPTATVSSLLADSLVTAMADFAGDSFRITGHSLGNQVAIAVAGDILSRLQDGRISNHKLLPTRIALLDPYYSGTKLRGLSDTTANLAASIMNALKTNQLGSAPVVFEAYRSSVLAAQNSSVVLKKGNAAIVSLRPQYYGATEFARKHQVGWWWYYWAKEFPVPMINNGGSSRGLSASASYDEVKAYMDSTRFLDQAQDTASKTKSPSDDVFTLQNR